MFLIKLIRGVLIFLVIMLIGGWVCCPQLGELYVSFYSSFSKESLLCWVIAAFIAGVSFSFGLKFSNPRRKKDETKKS